MMSINNRTVLIGFIALVLFISSCSSEEGANYEIVGDSVLVNDSFLYMLVTPHTIQHSQWVELEFESKLFTGDIDFVFGFDSTDGVYPSEARRYVDPQQISSNETTTYNCDHEFNYTVDPNFFTCYNVENSTLIFEHEFDGGNLQEQTAWWQELEYSNWVNWKPDNSIDYDFLGMDKWYYSKNQNINADQLYKIKYYLNIPINTSSGKYTLAIKPSSETVEEAINNDHFWYLDPWYDTPSLNTNLLAYYTFDDGDLLGDVTSQGRNLSIIGSPSRDATAKFNQSYGFPATADKLELTSTMSFTEGITVAGWYESIDGQTWAGYLWGSDDLQFQSYVAVTTGVFTTYAKGTSLVTTSIGTSTTGYIFVASTYDETNVKMYIGNATDLNTYSSAEADAMTTTGYFYIGDHLATIDNSMADGYIDEVGIWNRSLDSTEIEALWNSGAGIRYDPTLSLPPNSTTVSTPIILPAIAYHNTTALNCSAQVNTTAGTTFDAILNWSNTTYSEVTNFNNQINESFISANITLPSFKSGIDWNCSVFAYAHDNISISNSESAVREIGNYAPSVPTTTPPDNYTTSVNYTTVTCSGGTDPEGDTLNYTFYNSTDDLLQNTDSTTFVFGNLTVGNNPWYCKAMDSQGGESAATTSTNITYMNLTVCNGPGSYFINFTFVDEETDANVNGTQNIAVEDWYSSTYTSNLFDYNYLNASEAPSRGICVYPDDKTITAPIRFLYGGEDYESRTYENTFTLTNTTTQQILYQ